MLGKDLINLVKSGVKPIVEFNQETWEHDYDPDIGMRARIVSVKYDGSSIYELFCDLTEFEAYNKAFETPHWLDRDGNANRLWSDTLYYPKDKIFSVFLGEDEGILFDLVEESPLYEEYKKSKVTYSYIQWLETKVLELRK